MVNQIIDPTLVSIPPDQLGGFDPSRGVPAGSPGLVIVEGSFSLHRGMNFGNLANNGTYYCERMVRALGLTRLSLVFRSTFNQTVTVQAAGHTQDNANDTNGLITIGGTFSVTASGPVVISIDLTSHWLPWLAAIITAGATAPTSGSMTITAVFERWTAG